MTTALAINNAFDPTNLDQAIAISARFARSGLVPAALKGKPDDVLLVIMAGKELGFSTVQSLRSFYVLNGKLGMYADAMVGVCVGKPVCKYFRLVESTAKVATYETQREGSEPVKLSYTIDQAVRAKLVGNDTYAKHTEAMLRARCAAALARVVYPDFLAGIYEKGEVEEMAGQPEPQRVVSIAPAPAVTPWQPEKVEPVTGEVMDYEPGDLDVFDSDVSDAQEPEVPVLRVAFGKNAGKAVADLTERQVQAYVEMAEKNLATPGYKYAAKETVWLEALKADLERRKK